MSHVVDMECEVKDLDALEKCAPDLGMELVKASTYKWFGRHVGDYPLPEGFTKTDVGKCDYVLRIKGDREAYEVGVVKRKDGQPGYQLLWDFWAGGYGLQEKIGANGGLLKQSYSAQVTKKQMIREGYRVTTSKDAKGYVHLDFVE